MSEKHRIIAIFSKLASLALCAVLFPIALAFVAFRIVVELFGGDQDQEDENGGPL